MPESILSVKSMPVVDIGPLLDGTEQRLQVADHLRDACRTTGFFYIIGHRVPEKLCARLENLSRQFFARDISEKMAMHMNLGGRAWRGYFPVGEELTSGKPDIKEGIYFGAELPPDHPLVQSGTPMHGPNLFPRIPGFRETVLEYMEEQTRVGHAVMRGIALSLNLPENYFYSRYTSDPLILFRIFNYPYRDQTQEGHWGVGEHTDYGLLTILYQDECGGLEVKSGREWISAPPVPDSFVCNIGDMLDRMTKGFYKSTPHRVRNTARTDRLSFPFFFDPNFNAQVCAIEELGIELHDDSQERWDKKNIHDVTGTYGNYLLKKVSKVFPQLRNEVFD